MLKVLTKHKAEKATPLNVVFAGNPNVGKTTLFNTLTHSSLRTGNYHGVTCSPSQKTVGGITYTDVPGMYSFNAYTMEEGSAGEAVKGADLVINAVDATTLSASLNLTKKIMECNPRTIIYITKSDLLKKRGGKLDYSALSNLLGVPVIADIKSLKRFLHDIAGTASSNGANGENFPLYSPNTKFNKNALDGIYYGGNRNFGRAERLFYNKFFAVLFFIGYMLLSFFITFHSSMPGAYLKGILELLLCNKLPELISSHMVNPVLSSFICEGVISGVGGVLSFIPQIAFLYFFLIVLDESGVASALTFITDGLFEKVGLSGRATFSLMSGFGCTAAAISTTRGFAEESSRSKVIAVLPFIPCGAKTPVFLTFLAPLFKNPFPAVCILYFLGIALAITFSAILKGRKEGLISEVAPLALPNATCVTKKLYFQIKSFIIKVTTYVFAFCVISWLISHFSFTGGFCTPEESIGGSLSKLICYLFYPMGITDWRIAYATLTGFTAKENIVATLSQLIPEGLSLGFAPTMAVCVFLLCCPACISAFSASVKEVGFKRTLINNLAQLAFAFLLAYITFLVFSLI
ncbi:MAG: FeoB small GTPase domain-containing protein [Candidatus Coproplasma sp.]